MLAKREEESLKALSFALLGSIRGLIGEFQGRLTDELGEVIDLGSLSGCRLRGKWEPQARERIPVRRTSADSQSQPESGEEPS